MASVLKKNIICCDFEIISLIEDNHNINHPLDVILTQIFQLDSSQRIVDDKIKMLNHSTLESFPSIEPGAITIGMALYRDDNKKPLKGNRATDDQDSIDEDVLEHSTWLILPVSKKIFFVYEHYSCKVNHLEKFINHFITPNDYAIKIKPILTESTLNLLTKASRISKIDLEIKAGATLPPLNEPSANSITGRLSDKLSQDSQIAYDLGMDKTRCQISLARFSEQNQESITNLFNFLSYITQNEIMEDAISYLRVTYKPHGISKQVEIDLKNHNQKKFPVEILETSYEHVRDKLVRTYITEIK